MSKVLKAVATFLASGTGRRLLVFAATFLVVTLNKHLGLELDPMELLADVGLALGYVGQSAAREAMVAHAPAKAGGTP